MLPGGNYVVGLRARRPYSYDHDQLTEAVALQPAAS
jgi:hypothetical protein